MDNSTSPDPEDDYPGAQMETHLGGGPISPFDEIRRLDEVGEHWLARDLMPELDYGSDWRKFSDAIQRAMEACRKSGFEVADHFVACDRMVPIGSGAFRAVSDYRLTRYASSLVAQNGNPKRPAIARAQTYFAVQTYKQEIAEQAAAATPTADLIDLRDIRALKQFYEVFGAALAKIDEQEERIERTEQARQIEAAGRQAAEEKNEILAPMAQQAEQHRSADGLLSFGDFANKLNAHSLKVFGVRVYHKDVWNFAAESGLLIRGNTVRNNRATSFATNNDYVRESEGEYKDKHGVWHTTHTSRLTAKGDGWLWDRAVGRIQKMGTLRKAIGGAA